MSTPNDESNPVTGSRVDTNGNGSSDDGRISASTGPDPTRNGRDIIGSNARYREQGKWLALAMALATIVYTLAQLVGIAVGNKERFEDIEQGVNTELPEVTETLEQLESALLEVEIRLEQLPQEIPTPIIQVNPNKVGPAGPRGEAGPTGKAGPTGTTGEQGNTGARGDTGEQGERGSNAPPASRSEPREPVRAQAQTPQAPAAAPCELSLLGHCLSRMEIPNGR